MKNILLRAKHWQIFTLVFGLPLLVQVLFLNVIQSAYLRGPEAFADSALTFLWIVPVVLFLSIGTTFAWQFSVVQGLRHKIPSDIHLRFKRFKVFFFIPIAYMCGIFILLFKLLNGMNMGHLDSALNVATYAFLAIVPLHILSIFCMIHSIFFVAKTIKTVEFQDDVRFNEFAGDFFLTWFLPVGIWFLQPRINRLLEEDFAKDFVEDFV